jgi:hypothetical protein
MRQLLARVLLVGCVGCAGGTPARVELPGAVAPPAAGGKEEKKSPVKAEAEKKQVARDDPTKKAEPFVLPDDDAGKLLAKAVTPDPLPARLGRERGPAHRPLPPPELALAPAVLPGAPTLVARLPEGLKGAAVRPGFADDEEIGEGFVSTAPPARLVLAAPKPARVRSEDVTIPPPLAPIATPLPDRVPLDDPAEGASAAAALAAKVPQRTAPAPYLRVALPDPFEHRRPLTLPPAGEATMPQVEGPRPPR